MDILVILVVSILTIRVSGTYNEVIYAKASSAHIGHSLNGTLHTWHVESTIECIVSAMLTASVLYGQDNGTCLTIKEVCNGQMSHTITKDMFMSQIDTEAPYMYYPLDQLKSIFITPSPPEIVPGVKGKAFFFDGVSHYVSIDHSNYGNTCLQNVALCTGTGLTFTVWINFGTKQSLSNMFIWTNGAHYNKASGYFLAINTDHKLLSRVKLPNGRRWDVLIPMVTTNMWHHIAICWSEQNGLSIFINGCFFQNTKMYDTKGGGSPFTQFYIGNHPGSFNSNYLGNFIMDELCFWEKEMSGEDIMNIYKYMN